MWNRATFKNPAPRSKHRITLKQKFSHEPSIRIHLGGRTMQDTARAIIGPTCRMHYQQAACAEPQPRKSLHMCGCVFNIILCSCSNKHGQLGPTSGKTFSSAKASKSEAGTSPSAEPSASPWIPFGLNLWIRHGLRAGNRDFTFSWPIGSIHFGRNFRNCHGLPT